MLIHQTNTYTPLTNSFESLITPQLSFLTLKSPGNRVEMMACVLSKSLVLPSSFGGCGGSDISSNTSSAPSLRRTFSAEFSSKNGFSPLKRISSSEKLPDLGADSLSSNDEERSRSGFDIWTQIQQDKNKKEEEVEPGQFDVWSSILSDKKKTDSSNEAVTPPYVHPLMKRASSLSEKSLEICTESLGSETGCEGLSSYASSETGDAEIEKEISNQDEINLVLDVIETKEEETGSKVEQQSITVPDKITCTELPQGSFPPPIRSLSNQSGTSLHMKTRRDNGRLVLEAVSMPSHNNFSAKRQNGRLLLTFEENINDPNHEIDIASDEEEEEEEEEEETKDEFPYKHSGLLYKLAQKPSGPITVHRLAHKPIRIPKRNSRWPVTHEDDTKFKPSTPIVHSLPPRPRVAQLARSKKPPSTVDDTVGAACFNTCDYYWKPTNTKTQNIVKKSISGEHDSWMNGCKERRRSLLFLEPFCIATS